ncbi:hypothetical protein GCM10022256_00240 [Frondihabitans peucedani]|uniref:Uncharacterized protein n=1 Tax=Frondihabitans peucedani TaxID=598626 RepID=A0ABP8DWW8_9MICO
MGVLGGSWRPAAAGEERAAGEEEFRAVAAGTEESGVILRSHGGVPPCRSSVRFATGRQSTLEVSVSVTSGFASRLSAMVLPPLEKTAVYFAE